MKIQILLVFLLMGSLISSASKKKTKQKALPNDTYCLISILENNALKQANAPQSEIRFSKEKKEVYIYTGCNHIIGEYITKPSNQINVKIKSSSRKACQGNIEELTKKHIESTTHYKSKGERLELYSNKKLVMILQKIKEKVVDNEVKSLDGNYVLNKLYLENQEMKYDFNKSKISIANQRISCNVGCNNIGGQFVTHDHAIEPLKLMMTEMFCEKVDALERNFTKNLDEVNSFHWNNDLLELYANEKLLMVLKRVDQ